MCLGHQLHSWGRPGKNHIFTELSLVFEQLIQPSGTVCSHATRGFVGHRQVRWSWNIARAAINLQKPSCRSCGRLKPYWTHFAVNSHPKSKMKSSPFLFILFNINHCQNTIYTSIYDSTSISLSKYLSGWQQNSRVKNALDSQLRCKPQGGVTAKLNKSCIAFLCNPTAALWVGSFAIHTWGRPNMNGHIKPVSHGAQALLDKYAGTS